MEDPKALRMDETIVIWKEHAMVLVRETLTVKRMAYAVMAEMMAHLWVSMKGYWRAH